MISKYETFDEIILIKNNNLIFLIKEDLNFHYQVLTEKYLNGKMRSLF